MAGISQYLTVTQVAESRGVSRQTVLESISRGTLKATKVGNQWLILQKDLDEFGPHGAGGKTKTKVRRPKPKS